MTHLGQRLSALIDGELAGSERERVLVHMAKCGSCRDEVAALRMLKRRMNALGEAAAGAGLTGRLMGLSELMGFDQSRLAAGMPAGETVWPPPAPPGGWPVHGGATRSATTGASRVIRSQSQVMSAGMTSGRASSFWPGRWRCFWPGWARRLSSRVANRRHRRRPRR